MRFKGLGIVLTVPVVLYMMSCGSSRSVVTRSSHDQVATYTTESSEEKVDSVMVAEKDTLMEVTTITVLLRQAKDPQDSPDTIRVNTVTDRTRARSRDAIAVQRTKLEVRIDTVYMEKRDSVIVKGVAVNGNQSGKTTLHTTLKWLFAVICVVIVLVLVLKFFR